jgi:protein arginine kinase
MKWYLETGPEGDVVISSRVRVARNLAEYPFPSRMKPEQAKQVEEAAKKALLDSGDKLAEGFEFIDMSKLTPARAMSLAERHLISPDFAKKRGGALLLNNDESVSIMLNEEDHIRIQTLFAGQRLDEALALAGKIDDIFDRSLKYAFDENLGYLTQCPTNLGTGLRASLMLHLPATAASGAMPELVAAVSQLGIAIRGTYGEGSAALGAFYQISNQVTLGVSEKETVDSLSGIAAQIIAQERAARDAIGKSGPALEDRIWRSYAILKNARVLSGEEFMTLVSDLRLGVTMGIIDSVSLETINGLICQAQSATLMTSAGRNLDASDRDVLRANTVRGALA